MIQVIERFHKIMELVSYEPDRPHALSEFAETIDVSAPACSNIVRTMTELGYLRSLGPRRGFVMGDTPFFLTRRGPFRRHLVEPAMPIMKKLEEKINEFVVLVTENNGNRYELIRLEGNAVLRVTPDPGLRNLLQSATGCAILAHKTDEEIIAYWDSYHSGKNCYRVDNVDDLLKVCRQIREKGYYILESDTDDPQVLMNLSTTIGIPVRENGKVVAAVGIMAPALRMRNGNRERVIAAGFEAAREIEQKIN